jgi:hypothetical protein
MLKIEQSNPNIFYTSIPVNWDNTFKYWNHLKKLMSPYIYNDSVINIDLQNIKIIGSEVFNFLYDLVKLADSKHSKIIFTNLSVGIEERINLLGASTD